MPVRVKKYHPALKHAGYSATGLLPGESAAEFEKLHRELVAELAPSGALENDTVKTMARLVWRKKNLKTFRTAELARAHCEQIEEDIVPKDEQIFSTFGNTIPVDPAVRAAAVRASEDQARKELGDKYWLVEIGEVATIDHLMRDLDVHDRLDAMIDKCLKRLLFLRGLKSLSNPSSPATQQRLAGSSRAA